MYLFLREHCEKTSNPTLKPTRFRCASAVGLALRYASAAHGSQR